MMTNQVAWWLGLWAMLMSQPSLAGLAGCTLLDVNGSGFGTHPTIVSDKTVVANLLVQCDSAYLLGVNAGTSLNGNLRHLSDGAGHYLAYSLFSPLDIWGDAGIIGSQYPFGNAISGTGGNVPNSYPIFGTLLNSDNTAPPGIYTDTLTITATYPPYQATDKITRSYLLSFRLLASCNIDVSGVHGSFGQRSPTGQDLHAIPLGTLAVKCSVGTDYAIGINAGQHFSHGKRHLVQHDAAIEYTLWMGNQEWGDLGLSKFEKSYVETYPAAAVQATGNNHFQSFNVLGESHLPDMALPPGNYTDQVNVTVAW